MWAGTVCFLVNHALLGPSSQPAPGAEPALKKCLLKNESQVIRSSLWFLIPSLLCDSWSLRYSFKPRKDSPTPQVCILQMPLQLLLSNWLWKRINSHDQEDRKRELGLPGPRLSKPTSTDEIAHEGPSQGAWWRRITVNLVILFYSRWWFCWGWFWPIDLPYKAYLLLWKQLCFQSSFIYSPASFQNF